MCKSCAPFTSCINDINNSQVDNVKNLDVVMLVYNLIEYRNKYAETSGTLWLYHKDTVNHKEMPLIDCEIILLISQ